MFVETPDSNAGLLHHISHADAFETEFAKPLGRNAYDPGVCIFLISFRITHRSPPLLPFPRLPFRLGTERRQQRLREDYRNLHYLDATRFFWVHNLPMAE